MFHTLWLRVQEPRSVSVVYWLIYVILGAGGLYALVEPPSSLEGEIGIVAMSMLASLLVIGGTVGAIAALPGWYWMERFAVGAVASSAAIYLVIVVILHFQQPTGNRLLQAAFVASLMLTQWPRWVRVRARPYRSEVLTTDEI